MQLRNIFKIFFENIIFHVTVLFLIIVVSTLRQTRNAVSMRSFMSGTFEGHIKMYILYIKKTLCTYNGMMRCLGQRFQIEIDSYS